MQVYNFGRISNDTVTRNNKNVKRKQVSRKRNKGTQTDYRESETQTDPWKPPIRLHSGADAEILTLTYLGWGDGLSDGQREIEKIKRMRMKTSWEALLSPVDCIDRKNQEFIIAVIDREEWAFRNKELERIAELRMETMKDVLKSENHQKELKLAERFEKLGKYLREMRERKIDDIKRDFCRDLRKLSDKYYTRDVGISVDPKKSVSSSKFESYLGFKFESDEFKSGDDLKEKESLEDCDGEDRKSNLLTKYLSKNPLKIAKTRTRLPDELCIRETRWTDDQLRKLHDDLKKIRLNVIEKANLSSRKCKIPPLALRKMSSAP